MEFDPNSFKCRCSQIGHLMVANKATITEKQEQKMHELIQKKKEKQKEGKDITAKQNETLIELIEKKNQKPELAKTTKEYLQRWYIKNRWGKEKEFSSKYTTKGLIVEDDSIDLYAELTNQSGLKKNEESFENDFITGTPDVLTDKVIDIKSSWDVYTFPLFKDENPTALYYWQLQGYMWLTGKTEAELAYCLVDTPMELIYKAINTAKWDMGTSPASEEETLLEEQITNNMTFSDIDAANRLKIYEFERSEKSIEKIQERVVMAREYLTSIHNDLLVSARRFNNA